MMMTKVVMYCNLRSYSTAQFLGMNQTDLTNFLLRKKLQNISMNQLERTEKFLKNLGYTNEQLILNGTIFRYPFYILDQKISTLKEGGFKNISPRHIVNSRKLINKDIITLKDQGHIPKETLVPNSLLAHLDPPNCGINIRDLDESLTFSKIHRSILTRYLVYKLETKEHKITSLFRIHHRLNLKPLSYLCWNINFALNIGYSKEKILNNIYILCTHPINTEEVIKELPQLLGDIDVKNEMFVYPKLFGIPLENIHSIYNTLKKHGIKVEAIVKSMNIFTLSIDTVELRLHEIQNSPEMRVLLHEPLILKLIVHLRRAKTRLKMLNEYNMKCADLAILGTDGPKFEEHVKDGKDINYNQEILRFIKRLLKCNILEFKEKLRDHPYYNYVPLITIQDSYNYLKSLQFSEMELKEVVQLLLYPRSKIKVAYDKCTEYCKQQGLSNIDNIQVLNLTLYFIEKDHHFTGNGIWNNIENLL